MLSRGYEGPIELGWRERQLQYVAQALNKNDIALACLSLLRMELPPLPSADHARAMAAADDLFFKYNPDWGDEPRVAAGDPGGGQWTTGGGDPASPTHSSPLSPVHDAPLTPASDRPLHYKPILGLPKNAVKVTLPDGTVIKDPQSSTGALMAPPYADYRQIYAAGQAIAGDNFSQQISEIRAAVAQGGTYDFQRDPISLEARPSYAAASNYSAGVFMAGAGYPLFETVALADIYALKHSKNYGSTDQINWIISGWEDANDGQWIK